MMSGMRTQKKFRNNCSGRQLSTIFVGGVSKRGLKGKMLGDYPQQNIFSKDRRQEVERAAKPGMVPNRHIFVYIFGQEIEERVEK